MSQRASFHLGRWMLLIPVLLGAMIIVIMIWARLAPRPQHVGDGTGQLAPCPDRPNCVSSQAQDEEHRMEPLPLHGTGGESLRQLREIIQRMPRTTVRESNDQYLHAEFRSRFFGFVDDVEFLADPEANVVHFRSASRLGYSDLGVNRQRMEQIRAEYAGASR